MNDIKKSQQAMVKLLRRDATKLETVAKHLRQQAKEISNSIRADDRAEKQRANFYSKQSKVDKDLFLNPDRADVSADTIEILKERMM